MFKNFQIIFLLLSPLFSSFIMSDISIHSANFCRLADETKCSQRNAPHIYQCGPSMCTRDETECERFLIVEMIVKKKRLTEFVMNPSLERSQKKLKDNFVSLQSQIKKCAQLRDSHEWLSGEMCIRERNCFQLQGDTRGKVIKLEKRTNCPCPVDRPFVCGSSDNYCSLNRKACGSFNLTNKNRNSTVRNKLLSIKKCGNDFFLI